LPGKVFAIAPHFSFLPRFASLAGDAVKFGQSRLECNIPAARGGRDCRTFMKRSFDQ
jgi:hypothetical protein